MSREYQETRDLMRRLNLHTVCEEAACPNIGECWKQKHATVMILGSVCTRACAFCNVATGKPDQLDPHEPDHVGEAVAELGLAHVVEFDHFVDIRIQHIAIGVRGRMPRFVMLLERALIRLDAPDRDKLIARRLIKRLMEGHSLAAVGLPSRGLSR